MAGAPAELKCNPGCRTALLPILPVNQPRKEAAQGLRGGAVDHGVDCLQLKSDAYASMVRVLIPGYSPGRGLAPQDTPLRPTGDRHRAAHPAMCKDLIDHDGLGDERHVFVRPLGADEREVNRDEERRGYNVLSWAGGGMQFWAVSDLNVEELTQLRNLLDARPAGPGGSSAPSR